LWCFRNSVAFSQQGCINITPTHEVLHFYHTPSRTCTRAHTHARYAHTHTHTRRHTRAQAQARTPRRSRASAFLSSAKSKKRITPRITLGESPRESPRIRLNESPQNAAQHSKNTPQRKKFNFLFVSFQCFSTFIR